MNLFAQQDQLQARPDLKVVGVAVAILTIVLVLASLGMCLFLLIRGSRLARRVDDLESRMDALEDRKATERTDIWRKPAP